MHSSALYMQWSNIKNYFPNRKGWEDCTEFLLKNGASTKTTTEDSVAYIGGTTMPVYAAGGKTPLHLAAERGVRKGEISKLTLTGKWLR